MAGVYDTIIVSADNALCIDTLTLDYQGEYVQNTPNSIPQNVAQKLNFSGDYTIAHIMAAASYNLVTCKGVQCGNIVLGDVDPDHKTVCPSITRPSETAAATVTAPATPLSRDICHCSSSSRRRPWRLRSIPSRREILVNGVAGEHGVYWSSTPPAYATSDTTLCGTSARWQCDSPA